MEQARHDCLWEEDLIKSSSDKMYNSLGEKQETKQQLKYVGKEKESEKKKIIFVSNFPHIFMF